MLRWLCSPVYYQQVVQSHLAFVTQQGSTAAAQSNGDPAAAGPFLTVFPGSQLPTNTAHTYLGSTETTRAPSQMAAATGFGAAANTIGSSSAGRGKGTAWWTSREPQLARSPAVLSASRKHLRRSGFHSPLCVSRESAVPVELDHCKSRAEKLKEEVGKALQRAGSRPKDAVKYVDSLQQLGIAHHFEDAITAVLNRVGEEDDGDDELFDAGLRFRVLRHNGYNVAADSFQKFLDAEGNFKHSLSKDLRGLLSLHEASCLGAKDEYILAQAMEFSREHLESSLLSLDPNLFRKISYALKYPRHMSMERYEARRLLEDRSYPNGTFHSPLFELASLDFNMVQELYQGELAEITRWWRELGLAQKLSFARDRPMECFLWSIGIFPDPGLSMCRIQLAKTVAILLVVDDIYDSYGSPEELVLFTNAIRRWDLEAMDELPEYMKICYMALYNTTNEISYHILKQHGYCITSHLRNTWVDLCEAFLVEAKWFSDGFVPALADYLKNGITTAGTYMALVHAFFFLGSPVSDESLAFVGSRPSFFSHSGRILRLWDDLGTAKAEQLRGDVASSIECCMNEDRYLSEGDARKHIRKLISRSWTDLNGEALAPSPLPFSVVKASLNLARTAQFVYQHGDDERAQSADSVIESLLVKPIKRKPVNGYGQLMRR
ncbi:hypothetical protein Taro_030413 [Colocasia esculenta]|uniref:Uncharacterized protein n=1 Tax=Colocasia esculenta TaxID=4460 RepID=A0A843VGA6_COLES|nr:hypothetical protein [Colocasia esculenta]